MSTRHAEENDPRIAYLLEPVLAALDEARAAVESLSRELAARHHIEQARLAERERTTVARATLEELGDAHAPRDR